MRASDVPKDDNTTSATSDSRPSDSAATMKPQVVPAASRAIDAYRVARLSFVSACEAIADAFSATNGTLPPELPNLVSEITRDLDGDLASAARRASHKLTCLARDTKGLYGARDSELPPTNNACWDGLFAVRKPRGWTSADVVRKVRSTIEKNLRLSQRYGRPRGRRHSEPLIKVGHGGTLDPLATGVLVIGVGSGCKQLQNYLGGTKTYVLDAKFGAETDTLDSEGKVVAEKDCTHVTNALFEAALAKFRGKIEQAPPMYSACKRNGRPLYALAREGKTVERKPRPIEIFELVSLPKSGQDSLTGRGDGDEAEATMAVSTTTTTTTTTENKSTFRARVTCSKGLYVRVLISDIGKECGTLAHMTGLQRTKQGIFTLENCIDSTQLSEPGPLLRALAETRKRLPSLPPPPSDAPMFTPTGAGREATGGQGAAIADKINISELKVGAELNGRVAGHCRSGVFVDVGAGRDGLIPQSFLPKEYRNYPIGFQLKVIVDRVDAENDKLTLSLPGGSAPPAPREDRTVCLRFAIGTEPVEFEGGFEAAVRTALAGRGDIENVQAGGRLPNGVAYVCFSSTEAAMGVVATPPSLSGAAAEEAILLKEHLKIRRKQLLVVARGLPATFGWRDVKTEAEKFGPVRNVQMVQSSNAGDRVALIMYSRGSAARAALEAKHLNAGREQPVTGKTEATPSVDDSAGSGDSRTSGSGKVSLSAATDQDVAAFEASQRHRQPRDAGWKRRSGGGRFNRGSGGYRNKRFRR